MQARHPDNRPQSLRTKSGRPAAPKLAGRLVPPHLPARSTKVSEKLVLLPETAPTDSDIEEKADYGDDNDAAPERDDEELLRKTGGRKGKSYAERLSKSRRAEKLARVTAYCTAQSYKLKAMATLLRDHHGARTKLYDDCLYAVYHLPLLPGTEGYRLRSSPVLKNPGGKAVLDEEIERSERRDYGEGFFEEDDAERFSIRGNDDMESPRNEQPPKKPDETLRDGRRDSDRSTRSVSPSRIGPDALTFAEMFIFSYGICVLWNFSERQEKDILADLAFFSGPQDQEDYETEEFHFEYSSEIPRPRIYNDMITLRSGDHMIKLTMSHAIAQSTKLSSFEQQMANQMAEAQHVPRRLALTGELGMKRQQVVRLLGALFKSRVDVNLCEFRFANSAEFLLSPLFLNSKANTAFLASNVLDTPSFFWDAEPTLHPLYHAVREYLEIKPRIQVLNERCRVFLDLAEILSDSIADTKMSRLTWIIIVLILLSIFVTCSEVFLRFGILSQRKGGGEGLVVQM